MSKLLLARVLVDALIGSKPCQCNELVEHKESIIKEAVNAGFADDSEASVQYLKELGVEPRNLLHEDDQLVDLEDNEPVSLAELMAAIEHMDKDNPELWTGKGAPKTEALEQETGKEVTAALRDEAFAKFLESQQPQQ